MMWLIMVAFIACAIFLFGASISFMGNDRLKLSIASASIGALSIICAWLSWWSIIVN